MEQVVSITSRGQMTIPKRMRVMFGVDDTAKAMISVERGKLVVTPRPSFKTLAGSLRSNVKLSDKKLRLARNAFATRWSRN